MSFKSYAFEYGELDKVNRSSGSSTNYMFLAWEGSQYHFSIFKPDGNKLTQRFDTFAYFTSDLLELSLAQLNFFKSFLQSFNEAIGEVCTF
jgi:hypothetical protein